MCAANILFFVLTILVKAGKKKKKKKKLICHSPAQHTEYPKEPFLRVKTKEKKGGWKKKKYSSHQMPTRFQIFKTKRDSFSANLVTVCGG